MIEYEVVTGSLITGNVFRRYRYQSVEEAWQDFKHTVERLEADSKIDGLNIKTRVLLLQDSVIVKVADIKSK